MNETRLAATTWVRSVTRVAPADGSPATLLRVAPDGKRLAYAIQTGDEVRLVIEDGGVATTLAIYDETKPRELAWPPNGSALAVRAADDRRVAANQHVDWFDLLKPAAPVRMSDLDADEGPAPDPGAPKNKEHAQADVGSLAGDGLAWAPDSSGLFVFRAVTRYLFRQRMPSGAAPTIGAAIEVRDSADPERPVRVAVAAAEARLAVVVRSTMDVAHSVWIYDREGPPDAPRQQHGQFSYATRFLTTVPGDEATVEPFWSPKAKTLGLAIAHPEHARSGLVLFREARGDGEIIYESDLVFPGVPPIWFGKHILFVRRVRADKVPGGFGEELCLLEPDARVRVPTVLHAGPPGLGAPRVVRPDLIVLERDADATFVELERPLGS